MKKNLNRCIGAYVGAAIGDAMGGPVECLHFERIRSFFPDGVQGLLPYAKPYTAIELHPGYALHADPGSVTDDTYIRKDLTLYFLNNPPPYTAKSLALWLADHAEFDQWWKPVVEILFSIKRGEADAETSGLTHMQGGGIGWWSQLGVLYSGDPERAAQTGRSLCRIWKAALEQDFCAAVAAATAVATTDGSDWQSVIDAMLAYGGPLSSKLIDRAVNIAVAESDMWTLARKLYDQILVPDEPTRLSNGPMPPSVVGIAGSEAHYASLHWAEQIPLAAAALVFGKGTSASIPCCVNFGRDCDTTSTTVGAWAGGLCGLDGLPKEWVDAVQSANKAELDLVDLATKLASINPS